MFAVLKHVVPLKHTCTHAHSQLSNPSQAARGTKGGKLKEPEERQVQIIISRS